MENIVPANLVSEMKTAYGDYAMAVIVGRAIPDLYDGLKPVTRRVLTAMKWLNLKPDAKFMKAARVDGETTGKLHPHGGAYGAMVTASQWWTNNHPLVDGHGNWGSPTDGPAASRYTEARTTSYAYEVMLQDTDTWETRPSYDGSFEEPIRFNARVPNVLLNGGEGIAVGMSTRIPTHNLRDIAKALQFWSEKDMAAASKKLVPDFPTGCNIVKDQGLVEYLNSGKGSIRMRAVCERSKIDYGKRSKRDALTFTNLPLHTNTEQIGEQIKSGIEKDKITTVADVRDESDRTGIRLVVVLKANVDVEQAEAEVFAATSLDTKLSASNLVIDGTRPVDLAPIEILDRWMKWRDGRLVASIVAELATRRQRLEVVQGLISALVMIDEIIDEIRRSKDRADARKKLMKRDFTELQANAILDMRLAQLTKLDEGVLKKELKEVQARIKELIKLNSNKNLRREAIMEEIDSIAERHGNARRSKLIPEPATPAFTTIKQGRKKVKVATSGPKPRYVLVDEERGILTQQKKLLRSSWLVQSDDKMLFVCDNGKFYKTSATFKGPLSDQPTQVLARNTLSKASGKSLVAVFKLGDAVHANVIPWETVSKTTSKGKLWLPEGAELIHLGGEYTLAMKGRKKDKVLSVKTVKPRPVGGKASKIANITDVQESNS